MDPYKERQNRIPMDTKLSRNVKEKTRRDRISTETLRKEIGIRKLLIELEEKGLEWLDHVKRMGGTGGIEKGTGIKM
jgi:hypothetical protein